LALARAEAEQRAATAKRSFALLEGRLAGLGAGESGLDAAYEAAAAEVARVRGEIDRLQSRERAAAQDRAAVGARLDALSLALERKDGTAALLASERVDGLLGAVAALVTVRPGYETAVSAALGSAADAIAASGVDVAVGALEHLRTEDLGRAGMLLQNSDPAEDTDRWPELPQGALYAVELVDSAPDLRPALVRLLRKVAVVDSLADASALVDGLADVTAVTRDGDLLSPWFAAGGSASRPSLIEVQSAHDEAAAQLGHAQAELERVRFALAEQRGLLDLAEEAAAAALARLHESDAEHAALAEEAGSLGQTIRAAVAEAGRLEVAITAAERAAAEAHAAEGDLQARLDRAGDLADAEPPDPGERDRLAAEAQQARGVEMEARLALRTVEERARALAGRADSLSRAARAEREARARAEARRDRLRREAEVARAVAAASDWLAGQIERSLACADQARRSAQDELSLAERRLAEIRARSRDLGRQFEDLLDSAHRDELARAQQQMRLEALAERSMAELGLEPAALVAEYGPDQPVPGWSTEPATDPPSVPYDRADQHKRLRAAERDLALLGKVNPLALEEFEALQERHAFLAEQLEDLRRTRADLADIIAEVDRRVEEVFAEAYADVERAFAETFSRLFPGGEGRLVLTEPGQWLLTGVDVEARPAGKKVKRLSLLSGGERALVAVAFLVALFKARPSPFYILDEVEAALDDVNLGRLLEIYEELRAGSQLLVITHQKRTMEIADALYGVTMRADGVSTVISQRLRDG